ncbi:MAG TPA: helix-turn-helix domain-containing protein [Armatimonadota bacterium]|jgi:DNA-binding transcriptional ArsR family regulator
MNTAKENLLLHPLRLRILLAVGGREVTAQQIAGELPDVPQATLYRHINLLAAGGMLVAVRERRVHNTIEKTYALPPVGAMLSVEDLKNAKPEDHIRLFTQYLGQLLGYYVRYVQRGDVDFIRDNVLFQMAPVYLSEAEGQELGRAFNAALVPYIQNEPSPERRRSVIGLMALPDVGRGNGPEEAAVEGADKAEK